MKYENDYFCVIYNDANHELITDLIDAININLRRVMKFFNIYDFKQKKTVYIWDNLDEYINYLKPFVCEYQDWMVADTYDNNINIVSYDLFLSGPHKNSKMTDYKKIIIHEFVHSCQQEINPNASNVIWFWEALATNLSNQELGIIDIPYSKNDIIYNFHKLKDAYSISYTIGQYLMANYSISQILEYVINPTILINDTDFILERTKLWVQSNTKT